VWREDLKVTFYASMDKTCDSYELLRRNSERGNRKFMEENSPRGHNI
jgi:hypothetical protein